MVATNIILFAPPSTGIADDLEFAIPLSLRTT
jgi:hypothetical protein